MFRPLAALLLATLSITAFNAPAQAANASLGVSGTRFVLTTADGRSLDSAALIGAVFDMVTPEGINAKVRIDGISAAAEASDVTLHNLSVESSPGKWSPLCAADAKGRSAAFPMLGRWQGRRFVADAKAWFLTCTSGSQAKCRLWGFDPWGSDPRRSPLRPLYEACQHMVRADYDGSGVAHTRDGTSIDGWGDIGNERPESLNDPLFAFEAGWGPRGAVCVARTRWEILLPTRVLLAKNPHLRGNPCDEAEARRRGAVLFNRSKLRP
jgi:hypothetical protein